MTLGLISDAHGNVDGLRAALDALREAGADPILFGGDAVGYYPFVNETIDALRTADVLAVLGNVDAMLLGRLAPRPDRPDLYHLAEAEAALHPEHRRWLEGLPESRTLTLDGARIAMHHGSPFAPLSEYVYPDSDLDRFADVDADVVVLGHTHWPMARDAGSVRVVNPGSCGQPRDRLGGAGYGLLEPGSRRVELRRACYDADPLLRVLAARGYERELIDVLRARAS